MKILFIAFLSFYYSSSVFAQKPEGEWTGYFKSKSSHIETKYSIKFLHENGKTYAVTRTDFQDGTYNYYIICKARVTVNSAKQKIILKEYESITKNTPVEFKDCFQKHTLWFTSKNGIEYLEGNWISSGNKMNCGNGTTKLQRENKNSAADQY